MVFCFLNPFDNDFWQDLYFGGTQVSDTLQLNGR